MAEHLTEHVADWRGAVVVERGTRTIRNVALAGAESKNGYRYAEKALREAAALYEGVPVFLDHPSSPLRPRDRSARDLAGSVTNARYEAGRLRGDVRTLDTEAGRTLLALAEADGPGVGMSHVVLAERSGDGGTVERIVEVVSVDAVAFPATTRTFRESAGAMEAGGDAKPQAGEEAREEQMGPAYMRDACTTTADDATQSVADVGSHAERGTQHQKRPGSLEGVLASVDAQLPGRLRRLAAAPGSPGRGRGVRAGVYPGYVLVEWRSVGSLPEQYALAWRLDGEGVALGDELVPVEAMAERIGSWEEVLSVQERESGASVRIEQLMERLRQTAVERDRLAERLAARGPTSVLRRSARADRAGDEAFVRAVRRR